MNFKLYLLLIMSIFVLQNLFAKVYIIYPNVNGLGINSFGYEALKLALEKAGYEYNLKITKSLVNSQRIRKMLKDGDIDITDFGTSIEYEKKFKAIYFPIDLGLNGWRVFLIHKDNKIFFHKNLRIKELTRFTAIQGMGWSDTKILRNANLKVKETALMKNLFIMLENKRIDYLPLGSNEAHSLLRLHKKLAPSIIVEPNLLLIYPFARFFFVRKENQILHDIILKGLIKAYKDGSFLKLFKAHKSNNYLFSKINLEKRLQIKIDNPLMSKEFKDISKEYFFKIDQ